jgi:hypothetical protein
LLDEVTMLKVVLAPLLNEGGITILPTASPSGEEGSYTNPIGVGLRLMTSEIHSIKGEELCDPVGDSDCTFRSSVRNPDALAFSLDVCIIWDTLDALLVGEGLDVQVGVAEVVGEKLEVLDALGVMF